MSRPEANLEELRNAFDRAVYGAERRSWIIGLMGMTNQDGSVTLAVPDRIGFVFVATGPVGGQVITIARNDGKVPLRAGMPVRMKRADDGTLVIYGIFNAGGFTDSGMSGDYTNNFGTEWHHHRIGSGLEYEYEGLMFERGRARPTTGMVAYMNAFRYYHGSTWKTYAGGTIDLTNYKPATSGHHAWVIIGVNPEDSSATAVTGPSVAVATALTYAGANDVEFEGIPVAAVKVRNDTNSIQDINLFADVHEWFAGLHYSELGDLGNVDTSAGYYDFGPYWNDELYYHGYDGYGFMTGGHKQNFGTPKIAEMLADTIDIGDWPSFGMLDVRGESNVDDDLVNITGGKVGDMIILYNRFPGTQTITIKNTGNINIPGDMVMDSASKVAILVLTENGWMSSASIPSVVSSPLALDDLTDVSITTPAENDTLHYDGSEWINDTGHRLNMNNRVTLTISSGAIDITGNKTDGYFDVRGEGSVDDDLNIITGGNIGDIIHLTTYDAITYGDITVTNNNNIMVPSTDIVLNQQADGLTLVNTAWGWFPISVDKRLDGATVEVPASLQVYIDKKERLAKENIFGGLASLATAQPLDSTPTDLVVTSGIGKLLVVVNAGSDTTGSITVTGTSVDRDTGSETASDTDTLTIAGTTTDSSSTDGNGNTTYGFTKAYITSKWFRGSVTLSTSDLTLTDVDVYAVAFYQFGDYDNITLDYIDVTALPTNSSAWFNAHLYSLEITGTDQATITKEASLEELTAAITANVPYRKRKGSLAKALDGSTDGIWFDLFLGPLANVYWEDITAIVGYTHTLDIIVGV
jgi:hypothetical protein